MIEVKIKNNINLPEIKFQKDLKFIADRIFIPSLAGYINKRKDIEGNTYKPLADFTIKDKGHDRPLIGKERKLFSSFISKNKGQDSVVVTLKSDRKEIGKKLQIDGVPSRAFGGKRFFKFFGISEEMEKLAIGYMVKKIKDYTDGRTK